MKRLWFLVPLILLNVVLAVWGENLYQLDWLVVHSSGSYTVERQRNPGEGSWVMQCPDDGKDRCEDMAEALNEAHERRMKETEQLCIQ